VIAKPGRPEDSDKRLVALLAAVIVGGYGLAAGSLLFVAVGALMLGYVARPEAERYYLEGFADGVMAGQGLERQAAASRGLASPEIGRAHV